MIIFLQHVAKFGDLGIHFIAGHLVGGVDQQKLPFITFEHARYGRGKKFFGNPGTDQAIQADHVLHAVDALHFISHGLDLASGEGGIH